MEYNLFRQIFQPEAHKQLLFWCLQTLNHFCIYRNDFHKYVVKMRLVPCCFSAEIKILYHKCAYKDSVICMFDTICPGLTRETPSKIQGQIKKKSEEEQHEFSMMDRSVMENSWYNEYNKSWYNSSKIWEVRIIRQTDYRHTNGKNMETFSLFEKKNNQ